MSRPREGFVACGEALTVLVLASPHRNNLFVGDVVSQQVSFDQDFFQITIGDQ